MTALLAGGVIAGLGVIAAQLAILFWQMKRSAKASDGHLQSSRKRGELQTQVNEQSRAIEDRDKAIQSLQREVDGLKKSLDAVKHQRDELLKDAFKDGKPSTIASAVRGALEQLGELSKEVSDVSSDASG